MLNGTLFLLRAQASELGDGVEVRATPAEGGDTRVVAISGADMCRILELPAQTEGMALTEEHLRRILESATLTDEGDVQLQRREGACQSPQHTPVVRRGQVLNGGLVLLLARAVRGAAGGVQVSATPAEGGDTQTIVVSNADMCRLLQLPACGELDDARLRQVLDLVGTNAEGIVELQPAVEPAAATRALVVRRGQVLNGALTLLRARLLPDDRGVEVAATPAEGGDTKTLIFDKAQVRELLGLPFSSQALGGDAEMLHRVIDTVTRTGIAKIGDLTQAQDVPLSHDDPSGVGRVVDVASREEIIALPSSRWQSIFGQDWDRKRTEYAEWAGAEAKISAVDLEDRTIRLTNMHELGGGKKGFMGSSNSVAWWPAELLRNKENQKILDSVMPASRITVTPDDSFRTDNSSSDGAPKPLDPCVSEPDSGNLLKELRDGLLVKVVSKARMKELPTRRWIEVFGSEDYRDMRAHLLNWAGSVAEVAGDIDPVDSTIQLVGFDVYGKFPEIEAETWWPTELVRPFE